jgi:hypothetical protein
MEGVMSDALPSMTVLEVVQIVANGGGMTVSATRGVTDLVQIAANLTAKATLRIVDSLLLGTLHLVQIAKNAKGVVYFD